MSQSNGLTRREVLAGGLGLPLIGGIAPLAGSRSARADTRTSDTPVRNIIYMVSDGMSAGVPSLAEPFSQLARGRGTSWNALAARPGTVCGFLQTGSLSSMVTDSAAASTAWGSGSQVFNGSINVLPDGTRLTPIAPLAKDAGRAIGFVTTTTITHATPAGFAAVQRDRNDEAAIALQYLDVVDVAFGGGREFFSPERRRDGRDVYAQYRKSGYAVCTDRAGLKSAAGETKILGCFSYGHMPYTIDVLNRPREHAGVPTLAEMTAAALKSLAGRGDGFLLQVEGGRIDHAAHANDAGAMLWDQLAFDDAVAIALAFARSRDDTLVVVTTDHGNANPGLNGMGGAYSGSTECFERLLGAKTSFTALHSELRDLAEGAIAPADVADLVKDRLGVTLEPDEAGAVAEALNTGSIDEVNRQHRGIVGALGQAVGNHTGIGWTGITHTNELGLTLASGPGSAHFGGIMHHVRVFDILCRLMGIEHENPSMTADQAKRHLSSAPILRDVYAI